MKAIKILMILSILTAQFLFAQSMKVHTNSGISEYSLSEIDSITFLVIPDTSVDLTRGLMAYYPFNGNSNDSSGNGNNGTVYGAVLADDHLGNANSAYFLDGIDDYIDIGNDQSLKPQFPVSFSCWIHYVAFGVSLPVFANNYDSNDNYSGLWLNITPNNTISIGYGDGTTIGSSSRRSKISTTITSTGVWYHVVGIIRGPLDMDIYLNGFNDGGTYGGSGGTIYYNSDPANIGRMDSSISGPANYYNGRIDELRIYNRELNEQEIQALYNE